MKKKWMLILLSLTTLQLTACGSQTEAQNPPVKTEIIPEQTLSGSEEETASPEDTESDTDTQEPTTDVSEETSFDADAFIAANSIDYGITITYEETSSEASADDGTVLLTWSCQKPVVSIEGNEQAAAKINADLDAYYATFGDSDAYLDYAKDDYAFRLDEGITDTMIAYSDDVYVAATRADSSVISFEITFASYTGGAHGNYASIGRNYNAVTGDLITFEDLSADAATFRTSVLGYLTDLSALSSYADRMFAPGTRENIESVLLADEKWFFTNDGIAFISDPYCLGPYAAGTIYFPVSYADIASMGLKEDYAYPGTLMIRQPYQSAYDNETGEISLTEEGEYSYDLNGDGTADNIAFYDMVYDSDTAESSLHLFINGVDLQDVLKEHIDLSKGYLSGTDYLLYDMDSSDSYVEIAVPFSIVDGDKVSYFFRYTRQGTLEYLGQVTGDVSRPGVDFTTFQES